MPIDQDWTKVWPSAHTFKWSAVPFPVRQGYVEVRVAFFHCIFYYLILLFNLSNFDLNV